MAAEIQLDPEKQRQARERADELREDADGLRRTASAMDRQAMQIEHTWGIPAPCHVCGNRGCMVKH